MKLSNCVEIISGGTPSTSKNEFWNGNIPWISIKDFNNSFKYIYKTEKSISKQGLEKSSTNMLNKDDIIISARGTVGCLAQLYYPMAFNQSCYGIRSNNKNLMQDYLYYWLIANIDKFKKQTHGAVFDTITKNTFDTIEIVYPSLEYQQHIVDIIVHLIYYQSFYLKLHFLLTIFLTHLKLLLFFPLFLPESFRQNHQYQHIGQ